MTATIDLANQLFDAIEAGDMATLRALYHPDAQIWHNTDNTFKSRDHVLELVGWMSENLPPLQYTERNVGVTDTGFVSRHIVIITQPEGGQVRLPVCIVADLSDGQVTHLYEYFDSATQSQTGIAVGD